VAPNIQKFCSLIARAKLVSAPELEKHYRAWRSAEPDHRDNLPSFVRHLVKLGQVTEAQVDELIHDQAAPPTAATGESEFDVELVRVRDPRRNLDRRDLMMILLGALLASTAITVPIAIVGRGRREQPTPEKSE